MMVRMGLTALALIFFVSISCADAADPRTLVEHVDALRLPPESNVRLSLHFIDWNGDRKQEYNYTALVREGAGSLVFALDGDQRGQKYLAANDNFWLYAPRTHRAIRLTPLQAIRGQASVGDISRLRFADDYVVSLSPHPAAVPDGCHCTALELRAASPAATYAHIMLYVASDSGDPVEADLMAASGRKLKTLQFGPVVKVDGQLTVRTVTYIDAFDTDRKTTVELVSAEKADTPVRDFRPEALPLVSE